MKSFSTYAVLVAILGATSMLLQGCSFGTEEQNCDGEGCSCSLTFRSFWARIHVSGIPIEHSSRAFYIPDVARDVPNATSAPCCNAIFDQIDYDEGRSISMPNKTIEQFSGSCSASPNQEVASAAKNTPSEALKDGVSGARKLRQASSAVQHSAPQRKLQDPQDPPAYQPIYDGENGQDCEVSTSGGFPLNNAMISSGSMKLRIKWADPESGNTPCCNALRPILENVYVKQLPESRLPADMKSNFCNSCKQSPNQGIALAAYRCFANATVDVAV